MESLTRTRAASPFRILTAGSRSSKPYVRLNRRLLYSTASAASQIPRAISAEDLDVLSRAILTFDHASSTPFAVWTLGIPFRLGISRTRTVVLFDSDTLRQVSRIVRVASFDHG